MYKLFTDKIENFEARIKLEGASLKKSSARLVVEAENFSLLFNGTIDDSGNVSVPVRRLKGLLDENTSGAIRLEVIAEDTFFTPWESTFSVDTAKSIKVEIKSQQSAKSIIEAKTSVEIKSQKEASKPTLSEKNHVVAIMKMLIKENINIDNLHIKKDKLNNIIAEYIVTKKVKEDQKGPVITKLLKVLEKRK
tara:strand:+ start:6301 stop:6879 length:579 start_codon:yes stop_codon:yes gene_type:complete